MTGARSFVREIRAQAPAGITAFDVFVSRNGESYACTAPRSASRMCMSSTDCGKLFRCRAIDRSGGVVFGKTSCPFRRALRSAWRVETAP